MSMTFAGTVKTANATLW